MTLRPVFRSKKGDTLPKIAEEFYGDKMLYPKIFEANRDLLNDPDKIKPGQRLRIPWMRLAKGVRHAPDQAVDGLLVDPFAAALLFACTNQKQPAEKAVSQSKRLRQPSRRRRQVRLC